MFATKMKILHTADWHIGQLFHDYDRTYEHSQFLDWLVNILFQEQIDVLLISGDVFDLSNPSATSVTLFYSFLSKAVKANPDLQIVVTAGNHDSASRLETPKPLLETFNIHIVGVVSKDRNGDTDYEKLTIPLKGKSGAIQAWCLAVPFLRMGDYPSVSNCANPYAEGVTLLYKEAYDYVSKIKSDDQAVIAMGHLHAQQAETTDMDKSERLIMGGLECIAASAFPQEIKYVALGHIHKAQRVGGKEHIRYCGSPIPMSFSEINYKHQVLVFDLNTDGASNISAIEIPLSVELLRVPAVHSTIDQVLSLLEALPSKRDDYQIAPYLQVRILEDGPDPGRRHRIEKAIEGKHVRLAKIDVRHPQTVNNLDQTESISSEGLNEIKPSQMFYKAYQTKYNSPVPESLMKMFDEICQQVSQSE